MQSVEGTAKTLECADCKSCFTSASLLLKHFAEHIIDQVSESEQSCSNEQANVHSCKKSKLSLSQNKKKRRRESILETVLRQTAVNTPLNGNTQTINILQNDIGSFSNTSSSDSFKSSSNQHFSSRTLEGSESEKGEEMTSPDHMVVEIGQRAKEKHKLSRDMTLVKFDLQKRLENCVTRLTLKQGQKEINSSTTGIVNTRPMKAISLRKFNSQSCDKEVIRNCSEEFDPLKYCVVTFEGCVEINEGRTFCAKEKSITRPVKGASNRKQLMPKKINRPKEEVASTVLKEVLKTDILPLPDCRISHKPSKRKYLCQVCSKSFGWSTDLKRHLLTHTGERPFKCQMCDATFTRNFLLQKHESRVHSVDHNDTRFTHENIDESVKSSSSNNEVNAIGTDKQIIANRKKMQNKVWKNSKLLCNDVKNSFTLNFNKTGEVCDKFASAKRKFKNEDKSFDHFPQNVFNIL